MAFEAMESVREAELSAAQQIEIAIKNADDSVTKAKKLRESILSEAQKDADLNLELSKDKANVIAEEIIVTAQNNAILEADKLKKMCAERQGEINKAIVSLIV